jgi:hypothetical protein
MKKNRFIFLAVVLLAIIVLILFMTNSGTTFKRAMSNFAVDDTSNVTKIFMADKNNNTLMLSKTANGTWIVNDKYPAQKFNIDMLLGTLLNIQVRELVSKAAHDNIIRIMAATAVKVEIYQWIYRIDLSGNFRFFPHEKLTKSYFVGGPTQSNRGTYMLMENSSEPFITYLPGLRGFISSRFMPIEKYWRDYTIFKKTIHEIREVKIEFPADPENSFLVRNNHEKSVEMTSLIDNQPVRNSDTLKVMNLLNSFRSVSFETLINDIDSRRKDSIVGSVPFTMITVTDTLGGVTSIKTFHKQGEPGNIDYEGHPYPWDLDRMYALVNEGKDFTLVQFYVFDKIIRPKMFYLPEQKKSLGKATR